MNSLAINCPLNNNLFQCLPTGSLKILNWTVQEPMPPLLVATMISPRPSGANPGHRAVSLLEDFHSVVRRQSNPTRKTKTCEPPMIHSAKSTISPVYSDH